MATSLPALDIHGFDRPVVTLLVDSDTDTREMYAEFLRRCGSEVEEAQDGREALAKALNRRPDVIVTSTRLPGINGLDLCRLLRRDETTSAIPIVFVTGDSSEYDVQLAVRAGATRVLTKPCLPDKLASEIQQILNSLRILKTEALAIRARASEQQTPSHKLEKGLPTTQRRVMLNHVHGRGMTTEPAISPPALVCPNCFQSLHYSKSFLGGVSARHPEQWDYFKCRTGCGTFQYRHRTRHLRQIS